MNNCIFCNISAGEIPADKVFENENLLAFLDIKPVNPGHVLIIPKKHFADLTEMSEDLIAEIMAIGKKIGQKILDFGLGQGFNICINTKKAAGQVVGHFHIHIIPRTESDGLELWKGKDYQDGEIAKIIAKIKIEN